MHCLRIHAVQTAIAFILLFAAFGAGVQPSVAAGQALGAATAGATYFVDSQAGDDGYSGTAAAPGGNGAGPWRTLAKLAATGFAPGDSIRLACGSVWHETLRLQSSGVAGSPITVAAASGNCAAPPVIDGSAAIPAASWVLHSGNIYRAPIVQTTRTNNLVVNGDFGGVHDWYHWSPNNDDSRNVIASCTPTAACMNVTSGTVTAQLISNPFPLQESVNYTVRFMLKAPPGTSVFVGVNRNEPPWDAVGYGRTLIGTGAWQSVSTSFVATSTLANARLNFYMPANVSVQFAAAGVIAPDAVVTPTLLEPLQLAATNGLLSAAHHPNKGYDATQPDSLYVRVAADSTLVPVYGNMGSDYLTTGPDLNLPAGATIPNGTTVRVRTNSYTIHESKTAGYSNSRIALATPSYYPIVKGWGYYLLGQLWMLDSPGEWFYDKDAQTVYVWMPDGAAPGAAVSATFLPTGIDAEGREYTVFDGLSIRSVGVGVNMRGSTGVILRNTRIEDSYNAGVDAGATVNASVESSTFLRTGGDAVTSYWPAMGVAHSTGLRVVNNIIMSSGVIMNGDAVLSLPRNSNAAILGDLQAVVTGNTIRDVGYIGIRLEAGSTVSDNYIYGTCSVVDDCGGIYTSWADNNSTISNNIVEHVRGSLLGKAPYPGGTTPFTEAEGIYLDNDTTGVTVTGNTVVDADDGVLLNSAANNVVKNNKLYANRKNQVWVQLYGTNGVPAGLVYGNVITGNQLVPVSPTARAIWQHAMVPYSTENFAQYDFNKYFDLVNAKVALEATPTTWQEYTLPQWQAAVTSDGTPRNLDPHGQGMSGTPYVQTQVTGGNIVPNGNLAANASGWGSWNATAPFGTFTRQPCAAGFCAAYTAGGSDGVVSSPNFSLRQGQWYRLSLDAMAGADGQNALMIVRRGNGNYEDLGSGYQQLTIGTSWKRLSFVFQASKSINVNDPVTGDLGARLDIQQIKPGQQLMASNVELVPVTPPFAQADILLNRSSSAQAMPCPVADSNPAACGGYARLSDDSAVVWPYPLAARGSEILYTRDPSLADADRDGIADSQDACPGTAAGMAVAADGCSFAQRQTTPAYKAAQTILFGAAPALAAGGVGALSATGGGSGNPVVFASLTAAVCAVSGGTVAGLAAGTCVVAANQVGNAVFNAAPQATLTISVGQARGFALTVSNANTAGGTVVSDAGGIACGPSCSAAFAAGQAVRLSAIPADGYQFSGWGGDCRPCGYGNACTLTMAATQSCAADFALFKRHRPLWMRVLPPQ